MGRKKSAAAVGPIRCTLDEMIERDLLYVGLDKPLRYKGFTIGKRGKQLYWYFIPTPNGFYRIYPQYEDGRLGVPRYVDATKTIVTLVEA